MHVPALCRLLIRALCLVREEQFTCRFFCVCRFFIANVDVIARVVIIEDFSDLQTIGQHKRLSLTREEGDPTK